MRKYLSLFAKKPLLIVVAVVAVGMILALLATKLLPPEREPWATWLVTFVLAFAAFLAALLTIVVRLRQVVSGKGEADGETTDERRAQRNRRAMLTLVKSFWVEGVLEQSVHGAALMALAMEVKPDAVEHPWGMVLNTLGQPSRPLARGTRILEVFDELNGALLILGEPGSGKTTTLLELARDTIARAEKDYSQPIPVVLNLSSWADRMKSISEWLVDELNEKYNIPKRIAWPWVQNDDLLVLADGLDEVRPERREACAKALNRFRQKHGLVGIAICSRSAEYEAMTSQLKLEGAVVLQPLTPRQVDEYLEGTGTELLAVRRTLRHDTTLQELARSPLCLSIMTLAYHGLPLEDLRSLDSLEARRRHLFDAYIQRMFERRELRTVSGARHVLEGAQSHSRYSTQQTIRWLAWLARTMTDHAQTVFLIEQMQPSWLQGSGSRRLFVSAVEMVHAALGGVTVGLTSGLALARYAGWVVALYGGLLFGLFGAMVGGVIDAHTRQQDTIRPVEVVRWSRPSVQDQFSQLALIYGLFFGFLLAMEYGVRTALGVVVFGLVGFLLVRGLSYHYLRVELRVAPNQAIRRSAKNATIIGLAGGLTAGVVLGLSAGMLAALVMGSFFALGLGLGFGGSACVQHYALRFMLLRNGDAPLDYAQFLDYAADRILLRKVGGGYIFTHRLLQEHFAGLELD